MNATGIAIAILGVLVIVQVISGNAIARLRILS